MNTTYQNINWDPLVQAVLNPSGSKLKSGAKRDRQSIRGDDNQCLVASVFTRFVSQYASRKGLYNTV